MFETRAEFIALAVANSSLEGIDAVIRAEVLADHLEVANDAPWKK